MSDINKDLTVHISIEDIDLVIMVLKDDDSWDSQCMRALRVMYRDSLRIHDKLIVENAELHQKLAEITVDFGTEMKILENEVADLQYIVMKLQTYKRS